MFKKIYLVAEVGCNHMGDLKIAKMLIDQAKQCGADYVKFQKGTIKFYSQKKSITRGILFHKIHLEKLMENIENI